jgi:hypothetical protein
MKVPPTYKDVKEHDRKKRVHPGKKSLKIPRK